MSETRRTWLATLALSAANAAKLIVQFAILPILARYLGPGAYGVVALAMPFILLANLLCDGGLGSALARRADCDEELESTVFWISAGLGALLTAAMCAIAWPAALLLRQPALTSVLIALSPILLIAASLAAPNARVLRERRFAVFATGDVVSTLVAAAVALGAAMAGLGLWSLVLQQLSLWVMKGGWVLIASKLRVRAVCRPARTSELIAFGLNSVGANVSDFVSRNVDNVLVGAILGVVALGHYAMAYQIIRMPDAIVSGPLYFTIFTAVARASGERAAAARIVLTNLRLMTLVAVPVFAGLALVADLAVAVVLGPKWTATGLLIALLTPAGLCVCSFSFVGATLMGMGRSDRQFRLSLLNGAAVILAVLAGAMIDVRFAAGGVSLALVAIAPVFLRTLTAETGVRAAEVLESFRTPALAALVMAAAVLAERRLAPPWPPAVELAAAVCTGAVAYALAVGLLLGRERLKALAGLGSDTLFRRQRAT